MLNCISTIRSELVAGLSTTYVNTWIGSIIGRALTDLTQASWAVPEDSTPPEHGGRSLFMALMCKNSTLIPLAQQIGQESA